MTAAAPTARREALPSDPLELCRIAQGLVLLPTSRRRWSCRTRAMHFGVEGFPDNWGIGEIRGNALRDLASLNKVEMLPWDEWGRMAESYRGSRRPSHPRDLNTARVTYPPAGGSVLDVSEGTVNVVRQGLDAVE